MQLICCQFSIVAVHGLDGHLEKSWTADNGILWLSTIHSDVGVDTYHF